MSDDVDATVRETLANIAKMDAMLKEADDMLARSAKLMEDNNVTPDALHSYIDQQGGAGKEEFEKEAQAVREEIERDLPKQQATRQTRVRPTRQMI